MINIIKNNKCFLVYFEESVKRYSNFFESINNGQVIDYHSNNNLALGPQYSVDWSGLDRTIRTVVVNYSR